MTSSIDSQQQTLVEKVVTSWYTNFEKPFGNELSEEDFLRTYHPDVHWYDHAFHICRAGHEAVLGLRKAFLHCNQPFRKGAVVELLWIGRCANDIVRPNGDVVVKGTGKNFKNHVCFVMKINKDGQITRIDEYYNRTWDKGVQENDYAVMRETSLKL